MGMWVRDHIHVEGPTDPEQELMRLCTVGELSRKPQTAGSGSVPFWALSRSEAKDGCDTLLQTIRSTAESKQRPWLHKQGQRVPGLPVHKKKALEKNWELKQ